MSETDVEKAVENGLLALVACNGRCRKAEALLQARGVWNINAKQLYEWKNGTHAAKYQELREKHAPDLEKRLSAGLRDTAMLASEGMQKAVLKAMEGLKDDKDPSKTAANLATVADKTTRNMLGLEGRPTSITETRNVNEILRSWAERGIVQFTDAPEEPEQIEEANDEPVGG